MTLDNEFVYGKMERALERQQALPPEQRCPELPMLLRSLRLGQTATGELALAEVQLNGGAWPTTPNAASHPELFKGLVHLLQSAALGVQAEGNFHIITVASEVVQHMHENWAQISGQPFRGASGLARQGSLGWLLLLARAVTEDGRQSVQTTLDLLSTALSAAFPDSPGERAATRQLAAHEWVPVLPPAGVVTAARQAQAHAAPTAARQAAAGSSAVARQLAADLAALCPDVSVSDLHAWALLVRAAQGTRTGADCPLELYKSLLVDAQQLFDGLGRPGTLLGFTVGHACTAVAKSHGAIRGASRAALLHGLFEQAVAGAKQANCWLAATQLTQGRASWCCTQLQQLQHSTQSHTGQQRARLQAALARRQQGGAAGGAGAAGGQRSPTQLYSLAEGLLQQSQRFLAAAKGWAPGFIQQYLQDGLAAAWATVQSCAPDPRMRTGSFAVAAAALLASEHRDLRCSHCQRSVLHLRKCGGCKQECARLAWKAGHKQECKQLRAAAEQ